MNHVMTQPKIITVSILGGILSVDIVFRSRTVPHFAVYILARSFNNRTFSTQNTKISARSLAISYTLCFQVRIVKKKKKP